MVCGLFLTLVFPYVRFACASVTGDLLMDPVWEAVSQLERQGIRVPALTCDENFVNRWLWKLLGNSGDNIHKADNIYAPEAELPIFLVSDPLTYSKHFETLWQIKPECFGCVCVCVCVCVWCIKSSMLIHYYLTSLSFSAMGSLFSGATLKTCTRETQRRDMKLLDFVLCQNLNLSTSTSPPFQKWE